MEFMTELWVFMKTRKKFWLIPLITILLILGFIVVISGGSALSPFIYSLF